MALHFGIQLGAIHPLEESFVTSVLQFVLRGSTKRASDGEYSIVGDRNCDDIFVAGEDPHPSLAKIVSQYRARDKTTTSLSIGLEDTEGRRFTCIFTPADDHACRLRLWTHSSEFSSEKEIVELATILGDVFEQFDFRYGAYMNEYGGVVPIDWDLIAAHHPRAVTLYSTQLVEAIGRDRLLRTPAICTREFEDGGVQLGICATPTGSCRQLEIARSHLNQ